MSLALSVGGGSEGHRIFPFLLATEDKEIIESRIRQIVLNEPLQDLLHAMTIVFEAKSYCLENPNTSQCDFIDDLFRTTIHLLQERWKNTQEVITTELLGLYYKLVDLGESYFPSPPLEFTWRTIISEIEQALDEAAKQYQVDESVELELGNLISLIKLLETEEPRFLKFVDFPKCVVKLTNKFFQLCLEDAQEIYEYSGETDDPFSAYDEERQRYESLYEITEKFLEYDIELAEGLSADTILKAMQYAMNDCEERAQEYYIPEPDFEKTSSSGSGISIGSLFSDL